MGVVIAVLYGLSIFSVLSLTALTNVPLEKTLRESTEPDLHLVLYASGARTPEIVGRLNLPTIWRQLDSQGEFELRAAAPLELDPQALLEPGWSYAVQLPQGVRVCCDGGDNACADPSALLRVYEGSVTPSLDRSIVTSDTTERLEFELSAFELATNLELDPSATLQPGVPIKAARVPEGARSTNNRTWDSQVSCRLETDQALLATGTLRFNGGSHAQRLEDYASTGTVEINYRRPR
jgi:hypothetical protein